MAVKKTQEQVIADFTAKHGDRYDYTKMKYESGTKKVIIICKEHGEFQQQPRAHAAGQGCPACNQSPNWVCGKRDLESFVARAKEVHGDTYDYSNTAYVRVMDDIEIVCRKHGPFTQRANSHLNGRGCPVCASNALKTTDQFINDANAVHGKQYDYSKSKYVGATTKLTIICREHGEFTQTPNAHLNGNKCPECSIESAKDKLTYTTSEFIELAKSKHGEKYSYEKTQYLGRTEKVTITCPEHGDFTQRPGDHINGENGCPACAGNQLKTTEEFVREATERWKGLYEYDESVYVNSKSDIKVKCHRHGEFNISPYYHLKGRGCQKCSISAGQRELLDLIESKVGTAKVLSNDRVAIRPYELDIYIPELRLAFEYHGDYYHSYGRQELPEEKNRHRLKSILTEKAGIKLYQFFEHEWKNKRGVVESMITNAVGKSERVWARKTNLTAPSTAQLREFLVKSHLQGYKPAHAVYGLEYGGSLVAVMSFSTSDYKSWEVERLASAQGMSVVGGAGKMLTAFIREHKPEVIHTFADARISNGSVYRTLGFQYLGHTKPNYKYIDIYKNKILSRISCQKHKLQKLLGDKFDGSKTEAENMFSASYRRIWDAGSHSLVLRP